MTTSREEPPILDRPTRTPSAHPDRPTGHPDHDGPPAPQVDRTTDADDVDHYGPDRPAMLARFTGRPMLDTPIAHIPARIRTTSIGAVRATAYATVHSYREVRPILLGIVVMTRGTLRWLRGGHDGALVMAEPDPHARQVAWSKPERVRTRTWRRRMLGAAVLAVVAAVALVPPAIDPQWSTAMRCGVLALVVIGLDIAGRRELARRDTPMGPIYTPVSPRTLLGDASTPHRQIVAAIVDTLVGLGHSIDVTEPWRYDSASGESTITLGHKVALSPTDLAAVAIAVGAPDDALTTRRTGVTGYTQLRFRRTDTLAGARTAAEREPGGSGWGMFELGRSAGSTPLRLGFIGEHVAAVGTSGAGKTGVCELILYALTDRDDVDVWAGDAVKAIVIRRWSELLGRVAYDEDAILGLLTAANAEIKRRSVILGEAGRDPDDPAQKWTRDLGKALVIVLDEVHALSGNKDIIRELRTGIRTGKELGVSFVLLSQRLSASDLGDTSIRSMIGTTIMLPMRQKDLQFVEIDKDDTAAGWAPHLLSPSTPIGGPGDVGVAFIRSPFGHTEPDRYRFDSMPDLRTVNRHIRAAVARRDASAPVMRAGTDTDPGVEDAVVVDAPVIDLGTHRHVSARSDASPIVAFLESVFDQSGDVEWLFVSDILDHARAAAGDPTHPHRAVARRIAEATQPSQRLARLLSEAGAPGSRKRGGSGPDRGKMVIDRLPRCTPVQDA